LSHPIDQVGPFLSPKKWRTTSHTTRITKKK
jgi:hypothetical protein